MNNPSPLARRMLRLAAAGALASVVSQGAATPASAQELFNNLMNGLGLTSSEPPEIEYRERAPLVIPPAMAMRKPEQGIEARQAKNWPQDPDVLDRKRRAQDADEPVPVFGNSAVDTGNSRIGGVVRPEEQRLLGRRPGGEVPRGPGESTYANQQPANVRDTNLGFWISPDVLRAQGGPMEQKEARLAPGVEPQRRYLTDPPKGMRLPSDRAPIKATREGPDANDLNEPNARQFVIDQNKR